MKKRLAFGVGLSLLAVLSIALRGWSQRSANLVEPGAPVRWLSTSFASGVATDGDEIVVSTRGALVMLDRNGTVQQKLWQPEAEWRAAAPSAAVGVRHWAARQGTK